MHRGYIKLWRASVDNKFYFTEPFTKWQAWMDLLLLANHKEFYTHEVRGITVEIKRGQVLAGEQFLADRWKWSRGKVRRYLEQLEGKTVQQIVQQKSNIITIISIVNWEIYQGDSTIDSTANGTTDSTTDGQQTDTIKNDNNDKNTNTTTTVCGEIFTVFEANYQKLTPQVTDRLNDLIDTYSGERVLYALNEGIKHNKRSLAYIEGILKGNNHKPAGRIPTKYTDPAELEVE